MSVPRVLTLDQSISNTGWALVGGSRGWAAQTGAWPLGDGAGPDKRPAAFIALQRNIQRIHAEEPLEAIGYETPIWKPGDKVDKMVALYGLVSQIEVWAHSRRVPFFSISQSDWRETFLGAARKGTDAEQKKRLAVERARQFGFDPKSDDEAEATGILDHLLHVLGHVPKWREDHPFQLML